MKKSALTLLALLAMTSMTFGVSLDLVEGTSPGAGLTSYTLQATGTGIVGMTEFTIDCDVNQVWTVEEDAQLNLITLPSEWLGDGSADGNAKDSYVAFGDARIPDLSVPAAAYFTAETNTTTPPSVEGPYEGTGTLSNSDAGSYDAYVLQGLPSTVDMTHDLLQLVVATGTEVTLDVTLTTLTDYTVGQDNLGNDVALDGTVAVLDLEWPATVVDPPYPGDADLDDDCDFDDFTILLSNYNGTGSYVWGDGDFNDSTTVDFDDFTILLSNYNTSAPAAASAVPEPSTIIMLILGALCLVGYRARK